MRRIVPRKTLLRSLASISIHSNVFHLVPPAALLVPHSISYRTFCSSSKVHRDHHPIQETELEIEVYTEEAPEEDYDSLSSADHDSAFEEISVLDQFAAARVKNFVKKTAGDGGASTVEVREVEGSGTTVYHARWRLPLPPTYGERWAEGIAGTQKNAEAVAMMHAERIIDALGFQLFQLSSRQKKHVEEVRKSGRWAPNPEDPLKPPNTPSPPPLQLVAGNSVRQKSSRLKLDHIEFTMVKRGSFVRPFLHAIASEYFYDGRSEERVRSFFSQQKAPFKNYIRVTQLGEAADGQPSFVAQLRLPIDKRYGDRICMGKGSNPKEAVHLACMHAELTIDALGLALFPNSKAKQSAHVAECRRVGRWCVLPGEQCEDRFNTPSPPPLALEEGSSSAHSGRQAQHSAVMTSESKIDCSMDNTLLMHSVAVKAIHCVHDVPTIDRLAYYHLERYLNREEIKDILSVEVTDWKEMFFVETLGMKGHHETHRGTVTVPLLTGDGGGDCFVAIGIAGTMDDAVLAASMHAMQLLHLLGRYTTGVVNDTSQWKALKSVPDVDYPPPVRCVPNTHLCRVSFAGITALSRRREYTVKMQADDSHLSRRASLKTRRQGDPLKMDMKVKEIMKAREKVSPLDWSTEADVESRIVVSPTVTVAESYGHTLTSARRPDRLCVNRLQDYLERHGKRLRMSLETSSEQVGGNVLEAQRQVFYTTKVVLPIPVKYPMNVGGKATSGVTRLVACGEGYTAADSIQMCAMHAELLLDTLGYCFYDHVLLQERHADTCMLLGRWAPSHLGELTPAAFHIPPPPIRKECNQSTAWSAVENKYSRVTPKAAGEPQPLDGATTEPNSEASEEELFNLDKMKFIHPKELFRDAQKHMEFYCRNRGVEYHQTLKQYSFSDPSRGMVHRCQVQVPVPAQYGKRIAVGCAATKRLSFLLCAMHATQILDALHIPIYFGQQQVKYATLARRKGVSSPVRGQLAAGPSTPSPPGLYCFEETQEMVGIPVAPVFEDLVKSTAIWETYIAECKRYLNRKADAEVVKAVLQERRCPRTGIEEVDIGLEAVEQAPLNPSARVHLEELCKRHGLPPPPYFRYEPYGRGDEKVYYGSAAVKGTPYEARGRAKSGHDCVLRMAMHYEYIVKQIVIPNSGKPAVAIRTGPQSGRRPSKTHTCLNEFYDVERAVLTDKGKLIAMAIYTQTNKPFLPLQVRFKPGTKGDTVVCIAQIRDSTDTMTMGKSEVASKESGAEEEAKRLAVNDLFMKLQQKPVFHAVMQFLKSNTQLLLQPVLLTVPEPLQKKMDAVSPLPTLPPFHVEREAAKAALTTVSADFAESEPVKVIQTIASSTLGLSAHPGPLTLPPKLEQQLTVMGLLCRDGASHNGKPLSGTHYELTLQGVLVSLLLPCLPDMPSFSGVSMLMNFMECGVDNFEKPSGVALCHRGPLLPLELSKVLLAGFLLRCPRWAIRLVAVLVSAIVGPKPFLTQFASDTKEFLAKDIIDLTLQSSEADANLPQVSVDHITEYEKKVEENLIRLTSSLVEHSQDKHHKAHIAALFDWGSESIEPYSQLTAAQQARLEAQLQCCVAFGTYPSVYAVTETSASHLRAERMDEKGRWSTDIVPLAGPLRQHARLYYTFDVDVETHVSESAKASWKPTGAGNKTRAGAVCDPTAAVVATVRDSHNAPHILHMVEEINGERMWLLADGTVPLLLPPGTDKVGGLRQIQNACDAYFTACVPIPVEWLTVLADVLHCKEKYTPLPLEV